MDRHVIKGRGPNRGKYLWHRYSHKAQKAVTSWTRRQRKATGFDPPTRDPLYGSQWHMDLARKHDGYFVKMVAPEAIIERVDDLQAFIRAHAARADERIAGYWFSADFHDAGADFCRECAEKLVESKYAEDPKGFEKLYGKCGTAEQRYNAAIDGGWSQEHDSTPFCEDCGAKLEGSLTTYGSDEELGALTGECAPTFDDPNGWDDLDYAVTNLDDDDPRWRAIARVVDAAAAAEREHDAQVAAFAVLPGMAEARTSLLALLAARMEQKAPEPSYRLWDEFQAWMLVRHDKTPETLATEKRLFKEAICFLGFCGIKAYMTRGGMGMAAAPHGTYYWPFIVETEQRRLWKDVDMAAGHAVGLRCLDSDDAPGRDDNPFKEDGYDAPRARAWDAGFLLGLHEASGSKDEDAARRSAPPSPVSYVLPAAR